MFLLLLRILVELLISGDMKLVDLSLQATCFEVKPQQ